MDIKEQVKSGSEFTESLLAYIQRANKKLNKDQKGCYVDHIEIYNGTHNTTLTVKFKSLMTEANSFTCSFTKYDY